MDDRPTCGKGLAEHAVLPAKLGELTDAPSRQEHEAYRHLAKDHRQAGLRLQAIAEQMAGYRDLPMGRHDAKAMTAPAVLDSYRRFVRLEQELLSVLQRRVEQDRQMLAAMGVAG